LGNHTDYNEGLALAAAIHLGVTVQAERIDADLIEVSSDTNGRAANAPLKNLQKIGSRRAAQLVSYAKYRGKKTPINLETHTPEQN
jgi:galactokinase